MEQVFKALKFIFGEALSSAFKDETHIKVRDCNDTVYRTLLELKQIKETKSSEALKKLMTFVDIDESYYKDYDDYMADVNAVKLAVNTLKLTALMAQKNKQELAKYKVLEKFSNQETVYSVYGTHTNEIVLVDFSLGRIHITKNRDINDIYTLYIEDYKKTYWLREDKSE